MQIIERKNKHLYSFENRNPNRWNTYMDQLANTQIDMCLWHIYLILMYINRVIRYIGIMLTPLRCQLTAFRPNIKWNNIIIVLKTWKYTSILMLCLYYIHRHSTYYHWFTEKWKYCVCLTCRIIIIVQLNSQSATPSSSLVTRLSS